MNVSLADWVVDAVPELLGDEDGLGVPEPEGVLVDDAVVVLLGLVVALLVSVALPDCVADGVPEPDAECVALGVCV